MPNTSRSCEACGSRMSPFQPRKRNAAGQLVCKGCLGKSAAKTAVSTCNWSNCSNPIEWHVEGPSANDWGSSVCGEHKQEAIDEWSTPRAPARVQKASARTAENIPAWSDRIASDYAEGDKVTTEWGEGSIVESTGRSILILLTNGEVLRVQRGTPGFDRVTKAGSRKVAHDSGDGERIFHCPFCGGGSIAGRSDGTSECQFCNTAFTVQVQPMRSATPQTIDGQPHAHPDMPGTPADQGPVAPAPGEAPGEVPPEQNLEGTDVVVPEEEGAKLFASRHYALADGTALPEQSYLRHLAIQHADDRESLLESLRERR